MRGVDMGNGTADRADKLASAHADLVVAVESLTSGDDWRAMLETASRFHRYSANNVFLIMMQAPEATRVAGYKTWQSLGRQVRKGERGIRILAPCTFKRTERDAETDQEVTYTGIRGFTTVSVFDVSQTDGAELPDVGPHLLEGADVAGLWDGLAAQVKAAGYTLERGDCFGANGRTDHSVRTVRVRDDVSDAQAAKTLAHELAHVLLHPDTTEYFRCRGRSEVEAESVAFLVCQAAGLSTDGYSWPYIAGWSNGDVKVIQETAERVLGAARTILDTLGAELLEAVA
jgi:antirestriction protein ArdC